MIESIAKSKGIAEGTAEWEELTQAVHAYLGALEGVSQYAEASKALEEIAKKTNTTKNKVLEFYNSLSEEDKKLFF
jgi:hypothetical protein